MKGWISRLILASLAAATAYSQSTTVRVAANLVLTPVSVADAGGKSVRDLGLEDFEIEESGVRIAPSRLGECGEAPLELAMLFDTSGSVYMRFELERQAAARFLRRTMRQKDAAFILMVANEPKILKERTFSLDALLDAIAGISRTREATAFYNSVVKAAYMLREVDRPDARRVMVALSDGEDNRSIENKPEDVLRELQLSSCLFYSINPAGGAYKKNFIARRAQERMETLALQTGGATFVADNVEELEEFYDRIADELQGQYLLGYYSPATTGPAIYRRIAVKVRGRPDLRVKARPGYYPK